MTDAMRRYRRLQQQLWLRRWLNGGQESAAEDVLLEEMDVAWAALEAEDRRVLDAEGPSCWPMDTASQMPAVQELARVFKPEQLGYRGFASIDQALQPAAPTGAE